MTFIPNPNGDSMFARVEDSCEQILCQLIKRHPQLMDMRLSQKGPVPFDMEIGMDISFQLRRLIRKYPDLKDAHEERDWGK